MSDECQAKDPSTCRVHGNKPPQKMAPAKARELLERGIEVTDRKGRKIHFGKRLMAHYEGKPEADVNGRLASLEYALDAVRTVEPIHHPRGMADRDLYVKPIPGTNRSILVLVDTTSDTVYEVFDVYRKRQKKA